MKGRKRDRRPVDLGAFPLETLKHDESIVGSEISRKRPVYKPGNPAADRPLWRATQKYQSVYEELRDVKIFSKRAPSRPILHIVPGILSPQGIFSMRRRWGFARLRKLVGLKGLLLMTPITTRQSS